MHLLKSKRPSWLPSVTAVEIEHEDFWKVEIMRDKPQQDADRCDMTEAIADRLRSQFDLKA